MKDPSGGAADGPNNVDDDKRHGDSDPAQDDSCSRHPPTRDLSVGLIDLAAGLVAEDKSQNGPDSIDDDQSQESQDQRSHSLTAGPAGLLVADGPRLRCGCRRGTRRGGAIQSGATESTHPGPVSEVLGASRAPHHSSPVRRGTVSEQVGITAAFPSGYTVNTLESREVGPYGPNSQVRGRVPRTRRAI